MLNLKDKAVMLGTFVIKLHDSKTGKVIWKSRPMKNRIVSGSSGTGRNMVIRQLTGDTTYSLQITGAKIGTGTNTPADSDTDLQTPTTLTGLTLIPIANTVVSNDSVVISFYVTDSQLPNGTYKEFGMFCGTQMFTRALISPNFTKSSNQNMSVDYTLSLATA